MRDSPPAVRGKVASIIVHSGRVAIVLGLLLLLYRLPQEGSEHAGAPSLESVRVIYPQAAAIDAVADAAGFWGIRSETGEALGRVARTLPAAANIRGYRGVTEALIAINEGNLITDVEILYSLDTHEHVEAVRQDADFLAQFAGWKITDTLNAKEIDAVSGATLTSLAMARGVLARLGQTPRSLVFPEELTDLGQAKYVRSGPLSDSIVGYQGPTELLFDISDAGVLQEIRIRQSFDNDPYVGYVAADRYFWNLFHGKTVEQLSEFDLVAQQVEGVSGATMTSQAIAQTIVAAAGELHRQADESSSAMPAGWHRSLSEWTFSAAEVATIFIVSFAGFFSAFGLQRRRVLRTFWLITTIAVLGIWAGNLLSISLLAGWSSAGAAFTIAPGLAILAVVAILAPPLSKSNPYCNHLCPHGAVQQIVRPRGIFDRGKRRWQLHLGKRLQRVLKLVPGTTLTVAYCLVLLRPQTDLASWEPFHAYLYPIASFTTIVLFFLSLVISVCVPMGYCRFGCPTGSLLEYLRRTATSKRVSWVDGLLFGLLLVASGVKYWLV